MRTAQEIALKFWHKHAGSNLTSGCASWEESLSSAYPMITKSGKIKNNRMGAVMDGFILIDSSQDSRPIIIDKLSVEDLPHSACNINIINSIDSRFSVRKSVLEWMMSKERVYPFVAIATSKASNAVKRNIVLSESPSAAMLIHCNKVERFDTREVADMVGKIRELEDPSVWRKAAYAREAVLTSGINIEIDDYYKNIKAIEKFSSLIPNSVALPKPKTVLFDIISGLTEERPSTTFEKAGQP